MDILTQIVHIFLHINVYLEAMAKTYGNWTYVVVFIIIFCETGLVVTPFLPGDSLLFATGTIAALGELNIHSLAFSLMIAAILGNLVNYWIGRKVGPKVFQSENSKFFNKEYLLKTHRFYEKHGGKAIIIGRFLPIIRTFVPFVAGIGQMDFKQYTLYSVIGSILWIGIFIYISYYFGNIPAVKQNFSFIILAIILFSVVPIGIEIIRHKFMKSANTK